MGNPYNQLTQNERYQIQVLFERQCSARKIAKQLKRSNATISRELKRCSSSAYCAEFAERNSQHRRRTANKHRRFNDEHQSNLDWLLTQDFSPEQIAGRMKQEGLQALVSTSTLYRWIERLRWRHRLARKGRRYRKRNPASAGVRLIPNRVDIDERPAIVDANTEVGHWEGDTVHGQNGYLITLVERVTKTLLSVRVRRKTKKAVCRAIVRLLKPYRHLCHTLTFDNGGEFADHAVITKAIGCKVYFAKPYHSWQRGLNENTNGLLRRYYPKGTDISKVSLKAIREAVFKINIRPRKALNYLSPYELLTGQRVSLMMTI